jgi:hypothetical protein
MRKRYLCESGGEYSQYDKDEVDVDPDLHQYTIERESRLILMDLEKIWAHENERTVLDHGWMIQN